MFIKKNILSLLSILLILYFCTFIIRCDKSTNPKDESYTVQVGIVKTDIEGNVLLEDLNDWQPRCLQYPPVDTLSAKPAYPNPTNGVCRILFAIAVPGHITMTVNNKPNNVIDTLWDDFEQPGVYQRTWDCRDSSGKQLPEGFYRVFIVITIDDKEYQTYGDIQIIWGSIE